MNKLSALFTIGLSISTSISAWAGSCDDDSSMLPEITCSSAPNDIYAMRVDICAEKKAGKLQNFAKIYRLLPGEDGKTNVLALVPVTEKWADEQTRSFVGEDFNLDIYLGSHQRYNYSNILSSISFHNAAARIHKEQYRCTIDISN